MKVRIHLDGSQTITGTAEECAEFMGLRDQQCEWPEPTGESFSGFVTDHPPPRIFKVPNRAASLTEHEMRALAGGNRVEGLSDRDHTAAMHEARRLRIIGTI